MNGDGERNAAWAARWWPKPSVRTSPVNGLGAPPGGAPAYAQAAYTDEINTLAAATEGARNDTLNTCAFNLAQLAASGHLPWEQVEADLHAVALMIGLTEREIVATLRSAFRGGAKQPRVVPEPTRLDVPEVTTIEVPGAPPADAPAPDDPHALLDAQFPPIDWVALWEDDTVEEWIVEPLIPARRLVALFSPPKVGKSLLMLELAVAIARGEAVLGTTPSRPYRVLYVDFENDPRGDIRTRLIAMGRKPEDLGDLVYLSFPNLPYLDSPVGGLTLTALVDRHRAEVVIIDTVSRAVGGEENENDTWLRFYRHTGVALKQREVACVRLDHTGKDPTKGMRGGSAKYGDVDVVWSLSVIAEDVLQLECTANRLLVTEKHLNLRRVAQPVLRHAVEMRTAWQVKRDIVREMAEDLDLLRVPIRGKGGGEEACRTALVNHGWNGETEATLRNVRDARDLRRSDTWVPVFHSQQGVLPFDPPVVNPVENEDDE